MSPVTLCGHKETSVIHQSVAIFTIDATLTSIVELIICAT